MKIKAIILTALLMTVLALPALAGEVSQGRFVSDGQSPGTFTIEEYDTNFTDEHPYGIPTGIVSQYDVSKAKIGLKPVAVLDDDESKHGELLGVPVIQTVGHKGVGVDRLKRIAAATPPTERLVLGERIDGGGGPRSRSDREDSGRAKTCRGSGRVGAGNQRHQPPGHRTVPQLPPGRRVVRG